MVSIVLDDQDDAAGVERRVSARGRSRSQAASLTSTGCLGLVEPDREHEGRARAELARNVDVAAHGVGELLADGEAEAGAFGRRATSSRPPGRSARRCAEAPPRECRGRCRRRGRSARARSRRSQRGGHTSTPPWSVNFTALPTRFVRIWRKACASPRTLQPSRPSQAVSSRIPFRDAATFIMSVTSFSTATGAKGTTSSLRLPEVDPADVDEVGDQRHLRGRRGHEQTHELALLGVELGGLQELGRAQHAVHRRAQLVADIGEELGAAAVGRAGGDQRPLEPAGRAHGVDRADRADRRREAERERERDGRLAQDARPGARGIPDDIGDDLPRSRRAARWPGPARRSR